MGLLTNPLLCVSLVFSLNASILRQAAIRLSSRRSRSVPRWRLLLTSLTMETLYDKSASSAGKIDFDPKTRAYAVSLVGPLAEVRTAQRMVCSLSTHLLDLPSKVFLRAVRTSLLAASICPFPCRCATDDFQCLIPIRVHFIVNLVEN